MGRWSDYDLTGKRFERLVVIGRDPDGGPANSPKRKCYWKVRCDCGSEKSVRSDSLTSGRILSCGCYSIDVHSVERPEKRRDVTGQKFGRLTGISFAYILNGWTYWNFECECGARVVALLGNATSGNTQSCGCLRKDATDEWNMRQTKPFEEIAVNAIFNTYKTGAKNRGLCFELSTEQFAEILKHRCYYCGCEPKQMYRKKFYGEDRKFRYNGIDRYDNSVGYTEENCLPCCKTYNFAKSNKEGQEFLRWVRRVEKNTRHLQLTT